MFHSCSANLEKAHRKLQEEFIGLLRMSCGEGEEFRIERAKEMLENVLAEDATVCSDFFFFLKKM